MNYLMRGTCLTRGVGFEGLFLGIGGELRFIFEELVFFGVALEAVDWRTLMSFSS